MGRKCVIDYLSDIGTLYLGNCEEILSKQYFRKQHVRIHNVNQDIGIEKN